MLLGCIGDDFTGSSDLANTLAKGGMRTVQYTGVPSVDADQDVQAGVVASNTAQRLTPRQRETSALLPMPWPTHWTHIKSSFALRFRARGVRSIRATCS